MDNDVICGELKINKSLIREIIKLTLEYMPIILLEMENNLIFIKIMILEREKINN